MIKYHFYRGLSILLRSVEVRAWKVGAYHLTRYARRAAGFFGDTAKQAGHNAVRAKQHRAINLVLRAQNLTASVALGRPVWLLKLALHAEIQAKKNFLSVTNWARDRLPQIEREVL